METLRFCFTERFLSRVDLLTLTEVNQSLVLVGVLVSWWQSSFENSFIKRVEVRPLVQLVRWTIQSNNSIFSVFSSAALSPCGITNFIVLSKLNLWPISNGNISMVKKHLELRNLIWWIKLCLTPPLKQSSFLPLFLMICVTKSGYHTAALCKCS